MHGDADTIGQQSESVSMSESNSTAGGGASGRSMFDKVWDMHAIERTADGDTLLYVDRALIHEGARHAFDMLEAEAR